MGKGEELPGGDCYGFHGDFTAIYVMAGYKGTITLGDEVITKYLQMKDGTIDQQNYDDEISIVCDANTSFTPADFWWTGGTINSTATISQVNVNGATALIANTATLGSNLVFTAGGGRRSRRPGELDSFHRD